MDGDYISGGWQFDVFDFGTRVRKKKKRILRIVRKGKRFILKSGLYVRNPSNLIPRLLAIYIFAPRSIALIKGKIKEFPELRAMFGNPEFFRKSEYTQDKITPLNQIYDHFSQKEKQTF